MVPASVADAQDPVGDDLLADDGDIAADEAVGGVLTAAVAAPDRLDRAVVAALAAAGYPALSRARVQALIAEGRVTVDGRPAGTVSLKVAAGAQVAVDVPAPTPLAAQPQDIPLVIVYEDADLVIIDKPAGLVVHPAAGNPDGTLVNALLHHCAGQLSGIGGVVRPGIVHRIDKDTSGLLVVAKSNAAHEGLSRQFADHSIERAYRAVTSGVPRADGGTLRGIIARDSHDRKRMAILEGAEAGRRGKHAITHWQLIEPLGAHAALVECRLETGRTHQVRVHMASIGHALVGDPVYGRSQKSLKPQLLRLGFARQALHAAVLGFIHPVTGQSLRFTSDLPDDMQRLIGELRGGTELPGNSRALSPGESL